VSEPLLSGDVFARLADYCAYGITGTHRINEKRLLAAEVIFVKGDQLETLLRDYRDIINAKVLITGNSDQNFRETVTLPESVRLWLCQNATFSNHGLIKTIPIGVENKRLGRLSLPKPKLVGRDILVTKKIYLPPMSPTNPSRAKVLEFANKRQDVFKVADKRLTQIEYFREIQKHKFIFCCEGNGFDTHRVWETLYLGNFPVVLKSPWTRSLDQLGLPILQIENLSYISEDLLAKFLSDHLAFKPENNPSLWIPFWRSCIRDYTGNSIRLDASQKRSSE